MRRWIPGLLTLIIAVVAGRAQAYKILLPNLKIHETLTALSVECFTSQSFTDSKRCAPIDVKPEDAKLVYSPKRVGLLHVEGTQLTVEEVAKAARWSDDPQRKLVGVAAGNWIAGLFGYCADRYANLGVHTAGLLCASHFGPLQYLHAMAASSVEPPSETQAKMLEWSKFAFEYATGVIEDDKELCEALAPFPQIRESLIGEDDSYICLGARRWFAYMIPVGRFPPRTVGQLFGFSCRNPLASRTCNVGDTSVRDRKLAAIGSILHMIQDSFSQSHVSRGACNDRPSALIRTAKISQFLEYGGQDHTAHGDADAWPRTERADPQIDDPIQAGAELFRLLATPGATSTDLQSYLRAHVFALESAPALAQGAGAGACYQRK